MLDRNTSLLIGALCVFNFFDHPVYGSSAVDFSQQDLDYALALSLSEDDQKKPMSSSYSSSSSSFSSQRKKLEDADYAFALSLQNEKATPYVSGLAKNIRSNKNLKEHQAKIESMVGPFRKTQAGADVHIFDGHVAGSIGTVHAIADDLGIDNPNLSADAMKDFLMKHSAFYKAYDNHLVSQDQLASDITNALGQASSGDGSTLKIFSRLISLLECLENETGFHLDSLLGNTFDGICENRITGGGCFEGVRNRIFARYVTLLNWLME